MDNYRLHWTKAGKNERQVSAVSYSASAAETYKALKAAQDGVSDVEIVKVAPGT
ncbi:hypothetical protein [Streptomyces sp. NPDC047981]|uniref:hypothetical protein n=1 Tax=Streptomyces sp. NPDC047981 TaxID=3154610 RepID=UPI0034252988